MTAKVLNIGMIGLDTSHAEAFTAILNDSGIRITFPAARSLPPIPAGLATLS